MNTQSIRPRISRTIPVAMATLALLATMGTTQAAIFKNAQLDFTKPAQRWR